MTNYIEPAPIAASEAEEANGAATAIPGKKNLSPGKLFIWIGLAAFLAILGWGLIRANAERPDGKAPNVEFQFFDGYGWGERQNVSLAELEGKIVILNFWASWCPECYVEADLLEETWRTYADQDVVIVGVAYADAENKSKDFLEQFNITYPNAPDLRSLISSKYEITGVPETFFINKKGEVVHITTGPVNEAMINTVLGQLLAEG